MAYWKTYNPEIAERKRRNMVVFEETTAIINKGWYAAPSGEKRLLNMEDMIAGAVCYKEELPVQNVADVKGGTVIMVEENDCMKAAKRLVGEGYKPALLNFANGTHPGGGVETGARAQEESLCRCSTLTRSIYSFSEDMAKMYGYEYREGNNYPLDNLNFSAIYSPNVTFFREGVECTLMEDPFQVAVITCAALNLNGRHRLGLPPDNKMPEEAIKITGNKIRTIFRVALLNGCDSMVLGAFGCGAFKNPPDEVAVIFHQVMEEYEFKNKFRLITFSIIEDHNSQNKNLIVFQKEFHS